MPPVTATMKQEGFKGSASARMNEFNISQLNVTDDPFAQRVPEFYIGIFNVSKKDIHIPRPWGKAKGGTVTIPGRKNDDELYGKPVILKDVEFAFLKVSPGTDEAAPVYQKGRFMAQDLLNCSDPMGSWKTSRSTLNASGEGNNYYELGLFWETLESPTAEPSFDAIEAAMKRLESRYDALIKEANAFYVAGPGVQTKAGDPGRQGDISDAHHEAADYFLSAGADIDLPWHITLGGSMIGRLKAKKKAAQAQA